MTNSLMNNNNTNEFNNYTNYTSIITENIFNTLNEELTNTNIEPILLNIPRSFIPGEFEYISDVKERKILQNGWLAIEQLNMWNFMTQPIRSYVMSDAPEVYEINIKIKELCDDNYSYRSFGWIMRQLQYIAQNGEGMYFMIRNY